MSTDADLGLFHAHKYHELSDLELYAIRSTIKGVIRRSEAAFAAFQGDYERELQDIQATLIERVLFEDLPNDGPPTPQFRQELAALIAERGLSVDRILEIFCFATNSRAKAIEDLTEIEAMLLWHFVRGLRRAKGGVRT
jgi:hypothetical protein